MQKIYICDDNKIQLIKIKNIIQEEILKQEYNMKIEKCYTSSDELIFDTMESKETNIYFLDVCIESENSGFKTAIEVRNRQPNAFIIFITSHYEFVYNVFSYHIEPLDYIVNEINMDTIDLIRIVGILFDNAIQAAEAIGNGKVTCTIKQKDIFRIEIRNNYIGNIEDTSKLFEKGYTTKESGSGIGLYNFLNIIHNYDNAIYSVTLDNNEFIIRITIS